jgi:DNA-binding transcriptional MerR regulator
MWPILRLERGFHLSLGALLPIAMATQLSRKRAFESPSIPDRLYFKIGDVARICEVETYVLRFWETQFPQLKPNKSGTGQRLYRRRDVELALEIKRLVHAEGYTLSGARQLLEQGHRRREPQPSLPLAAGESGKRLDAVAAAIGHARAELREIAGLLASPAPQPPRRRTRLTTLASPSGSLFPS